MTPCYWTPSEGEIVVHRVSGEYGVVTRVDGRCQTGGARHKGVHRLDETCAAVGFMHRDVTVSTGYGRGAVLSPDCLSPIPRRERGSHRLPPGSRKGIERDCPKCAQESSASPIEIGDNADWHCHACGEFYKLPPLEDTTLAAGAKAAPEATSLHGDGR